MNNCLKVFRSTLFPAVFFLLLLQSGVGFGQLPILGIPYGHHGVVSSISFSTDGALLISCSDDGTLKLWDFTSGKLLKSSQGVEGPILGVSLSPQAQYAIFSWSFTEGLPVIWDIKGNQQQYNPGIISFSADGRWGMDDQGYRYAMPALQREETPLDFMPNGFTPDGKSLYKITEGQLQLWDAVSLQPQKTITLDGLPSDAKFAGNGRFLWAEVLNDNDLSAPPSFKCWEIASGRLIVNSTLPEGSSFQDITPDGQYLLLKIEMGETFLFDPNKNETVVTYDQADEGFPTGPPFGMPSLFSPDGRFVVRCTYNGKIKVQERQTGKLVNTLVGHNEPVNLAVPSSNGQTLVCTGGEGLVFQWDFTKGQISQTASIELLDPEKSAESIKTGIFMTQEDHRRAANTLQIWKVNSNQGQAVNNTRLLALSADGTQGLSMGYVQGQDGKISLSLWDMQTATALKEWEPAFPGSFYPDLAVFSPDKKQVLMGTRFYNSPPGPDFNVWLFDLETATFLKTFKAPEEYAASSLAFSADGSRLLIGTYKGTQHWFETASGRLLHSFQGHGQEVTSLSFSPDEKHIYSSSKDGTVKIWDAVNKKELATLIRIDEKEWIVLAPDGLFDASPKAMEVLYYLVDDQGQQEVVELEQLKFRYYEPGLLQKLMGYSDERIRSVEGLKSVPLYPKATASIEKDQLQISLQARNGGIGQVSLFVNGKEVETNLNPQRLSSLSYDLKPLGKYLFRNPDSTNIVSLRVYNQEGWLKSASIDLPYNPPARSKGSGNNASSGWQAQLNPKLYVVAVGTSDYTGTQLDLQYAAQDATVMARAIQSVGSNLFANGDSLEVYCLSTASADSTGLEGTPVQWQYANKDNVKATLEAIRQKAKAEDVLLVYLSGHGLTHGNNENSQFYYLTHGIASEEMISDAQTRQQYTISSSELTEWINAIPALKQVLVIDACNSGKVVENLTGGTRNLNSSQIRALDRMKDRTGMFILSGSAADKVSYEASEYGQGLLTYALLQGMLGVATRKTADGDYVDVMQLFQYARDEVPRLATTINGIQTPMLGFPTRGGSFDIGIFNDQVDIPLSTKKPVIIRSNFLNQTTLSDDLGLVKLLETAFREETEKGKDADLIYVDVTDYPDAYSLSGLYTKTGDQISITLKLFKGGTNPVNLEIRPTDDPERLARFIVREVKRVLNP